MKNLFDEHTAFTLATFTDATSESSLIKCTDEMFEVYDALSVKVSKEDIAEEYVDCVMCLFDSAAREGITGEMFEAAFKKKIAKNKGRSWVKNPDNTYSHVKI